MSGPVVLPVNGSLGPSLSELTTGRFDDRAKEVFSDGRRRRSREESERVDWEVEGRLEVFLGSREGKEDGGAEGVGADVVGAALTEEADVIEGVSRD